MKELGEKLKEARVKKGMSVQEISDKLTGRGLKASPKTVYSWESGRSQPTPDALLYMCEQYGISDVLAYFGYISGPEEQGPATPDEMEHMQNYRRLSRDSRRAVDDMIGALLRESRNLPEFGEEKLSEPGAGDRLLPLLISAFGGGGGLRLKPERQVRMAEEEGERIRIQQDKLQREREENAARARIRFSGGTHRD